MLRAHGGCLGTGSRRRTRQAAIVPGEPHAGFDPGVSEWGNPGREGGLSRQGTATGGTETSKYPEERKSTETPRVAASERGPAQTGASDPARGRRRPGVAGASSGGRAPRPQSQSTSRAEDAWEGAPQTVRARYAQPGACGMRPRVPPCTWNGAGSRGDHPPRLSTLP